MRKSVEKYLETEPLNTMSNSFQAFGLNMDRLDIGLVVLTLHAAGTRARVCLFQFFFECEPHREFPFL